MDDGPRTTAGKGRGCGTRGRRRVTPAVAARARLASLYDAQAPGLYRYALMLLAHRAEAEDAVQEAFTRLLAQERRGVSVQCPEAYLRTAVRNGCYTLLRRRRRAPAAGDDERLLEVAARGADEAERLALEQALRALPPEQREVVHLKVFEGRTFEDVARALGEPLNTVASRYRYALEKMRRRLGAA